MTIRTALQHLLPGYTGLVWNALPLGRALATSAWLSVRGAPTAEPVKASDVSVRRSHSRPDQRADLATYLNLTDASDLLDSASEGLPPLYFLTWSLAPYLDLISSRELSLSLFGILHVQNDLIVHHAPSEGDQVRSKVYVDRIHRDAGRSIISIICDSSVDGTLYTQMRTMLLAGTSTTAEAAPEPLVADVDDPEWETIRHIRFAPDLGWRYGCLTGDLNPIHLSPQTSRLFGLKRPIAHGFAVKASIAHALVRHLGGGRFESLRRLRVRFRAPVDLPSSALCQIRDNNVRLLDNDSGTVYVTGRYKVQS